MKIVSCIAIDPGDLEAEKKKDEELERMKQLQIESIMSRVECELNFEWGY